MISLVGSASIAQQLNAISNEGVVNVLIVIMGLGSCLCVFELWSCLPDRGECPYLGTLRALSGRVERFAAEVSLSRVGQVARKSRRKTYFHNHLEPLEGTSRGLAAPAAGYLVSPQFDSQGYLINAAGVSMAKDRSRSDLEALIRKQFPGMEHYFVQSKYLPKKTYDVHKAHQFFVYCGFVDSLSFPTNAQCWRSASVDGCCRLVLAEDPTFVHDPDCIPESRRRFRF